MTWGLSAQTWDFVTTTSVGTLGWIETANFDFTTETVAAPAFDGGTITVAGLSIGTDNGDGGAGRGTISSTSGTGITMAPAATTLQTIAASTTTRSATIITLDLEDLGLSTTDVSQDAILMVKTAAFAPADNNAYLQIGWEIATLPISAASTGRGEVFGSGRSGGTQQFQEAMQDAAGVLSGIVSFTSPPSSSSARILALRLSGLYTCSYYFSNNVSHFDLDDPTTSLTFYSNGTYRRVPLSTSAIRFIIAVSSPSVASPTSAVIQAVRVLKRGVV